MRSIRYGVLMYSEFGRLREYSEGGQRVSSEGRKGGARTRAKCDFFGSPTNSNFQGSLGVHRETSRRPNPTSDRVQLYPIAFWPTGSLVVFDLLLTAR